MIINMTQKYDRFDLEEEIMNVWHTVDDIDVLLYRMMDAPDGPLSEDEITNMLIGLREFHKGRCLKLRGVFEIMIKKDGGLV